MKVLAVCIPSGDQVQTSFASSLSQMALHLGARPPEGVSHVVWSWNRGSNLPLSRQRIAESALNQKATHLLWIDSDMAFPADLAHRLLAHNRPMVACNASTRRFPLRQVAEKKPGEPLHTGPLSKGLEKAYRVGFGVVLVEARVIRDMIERVGKQLFGFEYLPEQHTFRGEDYFFCERLQSAGYSPMIDHDLSKEIRHVGSFEFETLQAVQMHNG